MRFVMDHLDITANKTLFLEINLDKALFQRLSGELSQYQIEMADVLINEWVTKKRAPGFLLTSMIRRSIDCYEGRVLSPGKPDFLIIVLRQLVIFYEGAKLTSPDYINNYRPDPSLADLFLFIEKTIVDYCGYQRLEQLPQALVQQVFNPVVANRLPQSSSGESHFPELDAIAENATLCADFMMRLTGRTESIELRYNPALESERTLKAWNDRLVSGELDCSRMQFFSGPSEKIIIAGTPHRFKPYHAAIAKIINHYSLNLISADEAVDRICSVDSHFREGDYAIAGEEGRCYIL